MKKDVDFWFFGFCSNCGGRVFTCSAQDAPLIASLEHKRNVNDYYIECQSCPRCDYVGDQEHPDWIISVTVAEIIRDNLLQNYLKRR